MLYDTNLTWYRHKLYFFVNAILRACLKCDYEYKQTIDAKYPCKDSITSLAFIFYIMLNLNQIKG